MKTVGIYTGAKEESIGREAIPAEPIDVTCGLLVWVELRMLEEAADDLTISVVLAAVETAAESDVQPSSASISAMDCSILANVNSPAATGCISASKDDLLSANCAAAGKAIG